MLAQVHPTAVIDEGAIVGQETRIWHFSHLMPRCRIGDRCIVGQNVFIDNNVVVGNGVKIQNNVSLYNGVIVEDDVFIGPSAVFTNVINPRSFLERKHEFQQTILRQGCSVGANATIICGLEVGGYAFIGAGSVVTKDVKAFSVVYGNPAVQKGWISKKGYALEFNSKGEARCPASGEQYILKEDKVLLAAFFKQ